jgi:predicted small integral membrane protein
LQTFKTHTAPKKDKNIFFACCCCFFLQMLAFLWAIDKDKNKRREKSVLLTEFTRGDRCICV